MDLRPDLARSAEYWSARAAKPGPRGTRWWQSPYVLRHINRTISGRDVPGLVGGDLAKLGARFPGRVFRRGLSVGCGSGSKEMVLVASGLVEGFDLYEIAEARIREGRALAEARGLSARIRFHQQDAFAAAPLHGFDLCYWNNALHHMFDVRRAVAWSRERLIPGEGVFYMNDYVGPNRMQWTDEMLEVATSIRRNLPRRLLRNAEPGSLLRRLRHPLRARWLPRKVSRDRPELLIRQDPSECVDSEQILPALAAVFPGAEIILTGGVGYHLALNDLLQNFDETGDRALLDEILDIDAACARRGLTHYAVALAPAAV